MLWRFCSPFLRALFQYSKRPTGEAAKFVRSGVELLGVVGAARLECDEPAAEAGELIRWQLGNSFGDFFDFHVAQYSTAGASLSDGKESCGRTVVTKVSVQTSLSCRETGFCRQRQAEMLGFPSH
jgi:hypothetical protein